jgi:protease I
MNPDGLRAESAAVEFVRAFFKARESAGAVCHGPIMLVASGILKGRQITPDTIVQTGAREAGGRWIINVVAGIPARARQTWKAFGGRDTGAY